MTPDQPLFYWIVYAMGFFSGAMVPCIGWLLLATKRLSDENRQMRERMGLR